MKISKYNYSNTKNEIEKLRERVLALSNSKLPLMCFFNDIEMSVGDTSFDYIKAFEDLDQICTTIDEMKETIKQMDARNYNLKMQINSFYGKGLVNKYEKKQK